MIKFSPIEKAVHYPDDRRLFIGIKPSVWKIVGGGIFALICIAWFQYLVFGLPQDPSEAFPSPLQTKIDGFPLFVRISHWVNFFFLIILIRSGISILFDHPRLYFNKGCQPGTEWMKFTPVDVPKDKVWTAKDDARYISPLIGLPGYRHTVGIARGWHFIHVPFFILNGLVFVILLFRDQQWHRLIPASLEIFPNSWEVFVHYVTFNMPLEPNGFYHYNALQQLAYFSVVFILAPLAMLTGICMSPAIENRFHWLPKLFGSRQGARSVHFMVMISYLVFIIIHVSLVAATGLLRNLNHITLGIDDARSKTGLLITIAIVLLTAGFCFYAYWVSWNKPRWVQKNSKRINEKLWFSTINKFKPKKYFKKEDISPYFWANGKLPTSDKWKDLAKNDFKDYKLKVGGLVENPMEFSLEDLKRIRKEQDITMHHCIQGWSGIAEWGGLPISEIIKLVKPKAEVSRIAFHSFGEGLYGGAYYDTATLNNCLKPMSMLAWEMNYEPLTELHGAPLRLRLENQLGYKMVKWIERIEFIESYKTIGKGYGGSNEDNEYFDLLADT